MIYRSGERGAKDSGSSGSAHGNERVPGKRTLTEGLPVQRKAEQAPTAEAGPADAFARATSGGASPIPYREKMESAFRTDFSGVNAYLGGAAATGGLADLGARAAAHGDSIAFREAAPPEGLVAHELAHVVQQRNGGGVQCKPMDVSAPGDAAETAADAAADAVMRGAPVPDVGTVGGGGIHRAVDTNGGLWDTTTYAATNAPNNARMGGRAGAHIVLEFRGNDLVESTKIGLMQSVKAMKSSVADGPNNTVATGVGDPDEGQLILGGGQADPGREIDRAVHPGGRALPNTNPMYGVQNSPGNIATNLGDGTPATGTSRWGSHTKAVGVFQPPVAAILDDSPGRVIRFDHQTFEQSFETTAMAIEGPMPANTFLGSVSWGWRSDANGQVTLDPLSIVRAGTPSPAWMAAAGQWNAATFHETGTTNTHAPVQIPIAAGDSGSVAAVHMTTAALIARIVVVDGEIGALGAGTEKTNKQFEKTALETELRRRNAKISIKVTRNNGYEGGDKVSASVTGSNAVVARAPAFTHTNSQNHDYLIPLATLLPMTGAAKVKVFDDDWSDTEALLEIDWATPYAPAQKEKYEGGANYTVAVTFER